MENMKNFKLLTLLCVINSTCTVIDAYCMETDNNTDATDQLIDRKYKTIADAETAFQQFKAQVASTASEDNSLTNDQIFAKYKDHIMNFAEIKSAIDDMHLNNDDPQKPALSKLKHEAYEYNVYLVSKQLPNPDTELASCEEKIQQLMQTPELKNLLLTFIQTFTTIKEDVFNISMPHPAQQRRRLKLWKKLTYWEHIIDAFNKMINSYT